MKSFDRPAEVFCFVEWSHGRPLSSLLVCCREMGLRAMPTMPFPDAEGHSAAQLSNLSEALHRALPATSRLQ